MRRLKTIVSLLMVAAVLFLAPNWTSLEVSAAEPVTYVVKYVEDAKDWCYQSTGESTFDESLGYRELYYMYEYMKDGDAIVVYNESQNVPHLDLGTKRIGNLTVVQTASFTVINSGPIDSCYVLAGTTTSINGNVTNAFLYDEVTCNFGGNVKELTIYAEDSVNSTVGCAGTVGHLYVPSTTLPRTFFDYYDFGKETLLIKEGVLYTPAWQYSTTPSAASSTPATSPSSPSGEYDDVPKTGESPIALWLACAAALCMTGSYFLRKRAK